MLVKTVDNVLTANECAGMIHYMERSNPTLATIGNEGIRNNERVIDEDGYTSTLLCQRLADELPPGLVSFNPMLRYYKYKKGMRFLPHTDNSIKLGDNESVYTVLIYLNSDMEGGETILITEPEITIKPEVGKALIFKHDILHEGCEVLSGCKYVLRTDAIYPKNSLLLCS